MRVILPAIILLAFIVVPAAEAQQISESAQLALEIADVRKARLEGSFLGCNDRLDGIDHLDRADLRALVA